MQPKGVYRAKAGIKQILEHYDFNTVLDIGAGYGLHTKTFREFNKDVTPTDLFGRVEGLVVGSYMDIKKLKPWLPDFAVHGFNGDIQEHNWKTVPNEKYDPFID